ncbi:HPr-rel-A system PqqD family peptide chaperone [Sphingomonas hylomeconis]|uniref:HPr-rel-A system PqqD family peptide chaperone n=1 Tax=Sphingomonas hylomeconis TaxID=1395958 RepID=A0ABV7SYX1_9SPHN|nr:HPr-rel-A system PqqD family peptide chaperone [Sphingomonas hylomeconis]
MTLYRACRVETLAIAWLDDFTVVYHRPSGITHLLTAPAPEILAALGEAGMTLPDLHARLAASFELGDADGGGLPARIAELVAAGLVEPV